jgi:hypothetical protein
VRTTATVAQMLLRFAGLIALILGILFWTNNARTLVPIHMLLGIIIVLALWTLAFLAARAGVSIGLVALAFVWGVIVVVLGMTQTSLLPGSLHWIVQVIHLLVGLGAMGQGETLAARIKRSQVAVPQS